ncbi:MAG: hypothetical protein HW383_107 [Candidatus Magasanikbacteria bacterium]|nr:hypothetical protein [Candidatus Magasanikbacteria bacterium]
MITVNRALLGIAFLAALSGAIISFQTNTAIGKQIKVAEEKNQPAKITLQILTTPSCPDCFDIQKAVAAFKKFPVEVTAEKTLIFDSEEGKKLVADFGLERLPTFVASGDVTNEKLAGFIAQNGRLANNNFIFTKTPPVYIDPKDGAERGKIYVTILNDPKLCVGCAQPSELINQMKNAGIFIADTKTVSPFSEDGKSLTAKYKITAFPQIILSEDVKYYDIFKNLTIGETQSDGVYVFRQMIPPYFDLAQNKILGKLRMTMLADKSCNECYDPAKHNGLLSSMGVAVTNSEVVDVSSPQGKGLVNQYKIVNVPTIILSKDADVYNQLKSVWPAVGTVEKDGAYVFRKIEAIGDVIYKDLTKNLVIRPAAKTAAAGLSATGTPQ